MLTATYALVALSVEQASVRVGLLAFRHYVRSTLVRQNRISLRQLEYACATLDQLYQACHWRKIEMYLIPALRGASERADRLLDELSRLNQAALGAIRALRERLDGLDGGVDLQVAQVCEGIETVCAALLQRLEREELELFALARRVMCGEAWFAIANQFMLHDARADEARRSRRAMPPPSLATIPPAANKLALSVWPDAAGRARDANPANEADEACMSGEPGFSVAELVALPVPDVGAGPLSPHPPSHSTGRPSPHHLPRQPGANHRATSE